MPNDIEKLLDVKSDLLLESSQPSDADVKEG